MKHKVKQWLFILVFAKPVVSFAQNDTAGVFDNAIGLSISPFYSIPTHYYGFPDKGTIAGSAGFTDIFRINKKRNIYLDAELGYLNVAGITSIPYTAYLINSNGNYSKINSFDDVNRFHCAYLSVLLQKPILKFPKGSILIASLGGQINYCCLYTYSRRNLVDSTGNNIDYSMNYSGSSLSQKYSASLEAKVGFLKKISERYIFVISPVIYFGLNPYVVFTLNEDGFNCVGINFQLLRNFD